MALSVSTPEHLHKINLLDKVENDEGKFNIHIYTQGQPCALPMSQFVIFISSVDKKRLLAIFLAQTFSYVKIFIS